MKPTPIAIRRHEQTRILKRVGTYRSLIFLVAVASSACGNSAARSSTNTTANPQIGTSEFGMTESTFDTTELSPSYVNPKDALVEQDPRGIRATRAWAECMRTNGYEYARPADAEADISDRLHLLLAGQPPLELDGSNQALLVELQGEEKTIARADYDCAIELLDPVIAQVETEVFGEPQG